MKQQTPFKVIKTEGRVITFQTNAGCFKALVHFRDKAPEVFGFTEDAILAAKAEKAVAVGIRTPQDVCLVLLIHGIEVVDDADGKTTIFFSKDRI